MRHPLPVQTVDVDRHENALAQELRDGALASRHLPVEQVADPPELRNPRRVGVTLGHFTRHRRYRSPRRARQRPFGKVPDPLLTVAAHDHHASLRPEDLEQHRHALALVVPAAGAPALRGPILEVASPKRAATPELAQRVPHERIVRLEPFADVSVAFPRPVRVAPHRYPMDREVRGRHDVGLVLEQRSLLPQEPLQLGRAIRPPQPTEQDEVLGTGDHRRRVHLDLGQPRDDLHDRPAKGRVELLPHHRQLSSAAAGDADRLGHGPRA